MIDERDIGHKVRVINRTDEWNGRTGTLIERQELNGKLWPVKIDGHSAKHGRCWFMGDELERVPETGSEDDD